MIFTGNSGFSMKTYYSVYNCWLSGVGYNSVITDKKLGSLNNKGVMLLINLHSPEGRAAARG